ncbi:MAG: MBL fold metallo-hydrolase [Candidatus Pacebacteria bacterium]|nr:MBL fold metallo-hydrolase [Candidatus Paceibacterota bacterium]
MAQVKILVEGYTSADSSAQSGEEKTCPTITLIKDKDIVMVVDPGVLENQGILKEKLEEEGLGIDDVNIVFITHSHADHYRNAGMFPNAKLLEYFALWNGNVAEEWNEQYSEDIQIIKTPGHSHTGLTLLVKTDKGVVAVCGDVFWKENSPEYDPYATEPEKLKESRQKVLEMADWIIPGHAGIYKIER